VLYAFVALRHRYPPDYIIYNTGVHDMLAGSAADYERNLRWALSLIATDTDVLFWSSLPPRDPKSKQVQTPALVREFNRRAAKVMRERERAHYFDVYDFGAGK
jgi:hypothetical protein